MKPLRVRANRVVNLDVVTDILFHEVGAELRFGGTVEPLPLNRADAATLKEHIHDSERLVQITERTVINFDLVINLLFFEFGGEIQFAGQPEPLSINQAEANALRDYILNRDDLIDLYGGAR